MTPTYSVYTHIDRAVAEVFAAVISKDALSQYFVRSSSADLHEGAEVVWRVSDFDSTVRVKRLVPNERIDLVFRPADFAIPLLRKGDTRDYEVLIELLFETADAGGTLVTLSEYGWQKDRRSVLQSYGQCSGWQEMLMCLKAHLLHGLDLRSPATAQPDYERLHQGREF